MRLGRRRGSLRKSRDLSSGVPLAAARATSAIPLVAKPLGGADVRVTTRSGLLVRAALVVVLTIGTWVGGAGTAYAQNDPNPGALTFTGGLDFPKPVLLPRHPPGERCRSDDVAVRRPRHRPLLRTTAVSRARRSTSASGTACTRVSSAATARARSCTTSWISIRRSRSALAAASASDDISRGTRVRTTCSKA